MTSLGELSERFSVEVEALCEVTKRFPMRVSPYYAGLIERSGDPIWLQCIPDPRELSEGDFTEDPLDEEGLSPVPGLIHRYPNRVVLIVSSTCATFCRFCMRKRYVGCRSTGQDRHFLRDAMAYLEGAVEVRDVILSGGDPLLLSDDELDEILSNLRKIRHVEILRIGTRVPVTLPERITPRLCRMLKKHHPLYVNTHFNHPWEITKESTEACAILSDAGIPLGNQTVLLKKVNDDPEVMKELMKKLLTLRIRPYYLHHMDPVKGTKHFRTSLDQGLKIMNRLRGNISGLAVPYYMIDLPGGKGKVPILPEPIERNGKTLRLRNYRGEIVEYLDEED